MSLNKPGDIFYFKKENFLKDYFDKENDQPLEILILNNTLYGTLFLNNVKIYENSIINIEDVDDLIYVRVSKSAFVESINFQISDNNPNKKYSDMAEITITVEAYENQPPDQIGDNAFTLVNGASKVFTKDDLTTNTTPPYSDPEGDEPYKLKILGLPADGSKLLNDGVLLNVNDEVLFSDIELGLFIIEPAPDQSLHSFNFQFTISDVGSEQYP